MQNRMTTMTKAEKELADRVTEAALDESFELGQKEASKRWNVRVKLVESRVEIAGRVLKGDFDAHLLELLSFDL